MVQCSRVGRPKEVWPHTHSVSIIINYLPDLDFKFLLSFFFAILTIYLDFSWRWINYAETIITLVAPAETLFLTTVKSKSVYKSHEYSSLGLISLLGTHFYRIDLFSDPLTYCAAHAAGLLQSTDCFETVSLLWSVSGAQPQLTALKYTWNLCRVTFSWAIFKRSFSRSSQTWFIIFSQISKPFPTQPSTTKFRNRISPKGTGADTKFT